MRAEGPIISHPEWQSKTQRLTSGTLTIVAWAIWIYFWLPIMTACLWIAGIHVTFFQLFRRPTLNSLLFIGLMVLLCSVVVASWASYNHMRFARKSRRLKAETIHYEAIGEAFQVRDPETLFSLLQERRMNLYFDNAGTLIQVEVLETLDLSPVAHSRLTEETRPSLKSGTVLRAQERCGSEERSLALTSA
jgi:poly-beta-1,6-N-acetyl-D-glucosamine biosynthesis protein PgaD